jgi:hypothetical protein
MRTKLITKILMQATFLLSLISSTLTNVVKLPSIHWTSTYKLFTSINNNNNNNKAVSPASNMHQYLKMNAHIGDSIDLICPKLAANQSDYEYSIIYKVSSKYEFDNCIINPNNYETVPILKCDKPQAQTNVKFTLYFVKYSPVPNALEFEEGKEYYFLSTSSGARDGLNFMSGGLCSKFNMKFSIKIKPNMENSVLINKMTKSGDNKGQNHEASSLVYSLEDEDQKVDSKLSTTNKMNKIFASLMNSKNQQGGIIDLEEESVDDHNSNDNDPKVSKLNLVVSTAPSRLLNSNLLHLFFILFFTFFSRIFS